MSIKRLIRRIETNNKRGEELTKLLVENTWDELNNNLGTLSYYANKMYKLQELTYKLNENKNEAFALIYELKEEIKNG